jgi:hypothetical protein
MSFPAVKRLDTSICAKELSDDDGFVEGCLQGWYGWRGGKTS